MAVGLMMAGGEAMVGRTLQNTGVTVPVVMKVPPTSTDLKPGVESVSPTVSEGPKESLTAFDFKGQVQQITRLVDDSPS